MAIQELGGLARRMPKVSARMVTLLRDFADQELRLNS